MKLAALFPMLISCLGGQQLHSNFAGGAIGVTTLSADGQTVITAATSSVSSYKPENGWTAQLFYGRHVFDYFSVQGTFTANRNAVTLSAVAAGAGQDAAYEQTRGSRHQMYGAEAMAYFRSRASGLRPYLSAGGGVNHFSSSAGRIAVQRGALALPPAAFSAVKPYGRVAVGIDVRLAAGWKFRFSFAESILKNPVSAQLSPPGKRNLASFQNLFGFVREF